MSLLKCYFACNSWVRVFSSLIYFSFVWHVFVCVSVWAIVLFCNDNKINSIVFLLYTSARFCDRCWWVSSFRFFSLRFCCGFLFIVLHFLYTSFALLCNAYCYWSIIWCFPIVRIFLLVIIVLGCIIFHVFLLFVIPWSNEMSFLLFYSPMARISSDGICCCRMIDDVWRGSTIIEF